MRKGDVEPALFDDTVSQATLFPPFYLIESFADDVLINSGEVPSLASTLQKFSQLAQIGGLYKFKELER